MEIGTCARVTDDGLTIHQREGTVVSVDGSRISVRFGSECRYELYGPYGDDEPDYIKVLQVDQLKTIEAMSAQTIAEREFPEHHHSCEYDYGEGVPHQCMLSTCDAPPTHYTYVNFVGTVMRIRTCKAHHTKWNLVCTESLDLGHKPSKDKVRAGTETAHA